VKNGPRYLQSIEKDDFWSGEFRSKDHFLISFLRVGQIQNDPIKNLIHSEANHLLKVLIDKRQC
jgi:hypothetical protein